MIAVPLGRSGFLVSPVILGCGSIGGIGPPAATRGKGLSVAEGLEQIETAVEAGINVLDTANSYAGGDSERVVGRWSAAHPQAEILIETKVGRVVDSGHQRVDLTRSHILRQAELSQQRLGRIDLYLSHAPDDLTPIEETLEAFAELIEIGRVRAIGACNIDAPRLREALAASDRLGLPRYEWVQNEYNLLARGDEGELFDLLQEQQLGYTPWGPLCGGILAGRYRPGEPAPPGSRLAVAPGPYENRFTTATLAGVERLSREASRRGVSTAGLALAWVMSAQSVTAPLVAPRQPAQWNAVTEGLALRLSPDERARIAGLTELDRPGRP